MKRKKLLIRVLLIVLAIFLLVILGFEINFLVFAKNHAIFISKADNFSIIDDNAKYIQTSHTFKTHIYKLDNDKYKEIHFSEKVSSAIKCNFDDSFIVCYSKGSAPEKYGCSDLNGKIFIPIKYSEIECKLINDIPIYICKSGNKETTFYDSKGKKIYHSKNFTTVTSYNNELRFIEQKDSKFAIYDKNKKVIIDFKNDISDLDSNKYIVVINRKNHKYGVIDSNGNTIIDYKYDDITPLKKNEENSKNIFIVETKYRNESNDIDKNRNNENYNEYKNTISKYELLDENGTKISNQMYDEIVDFDNNYLSVRLDNKWGIIDYSCKVLLPIEYKEVPQCFKIQDKIYFLLQNNKTQYIKDKKLNNVIPNGKYEKIKYTNDYVFVVKKDSKFGLVDISNKIKASPIYSSITDKSDNGYLILKDGRSNIIVDEKGNTVFEHNSVTFNSYKNGLAYTGNFLFGKFIDNKGNTVIPLHINKENKFSFLFKVSPCCPTSCYENNGEKLVEIDGVIGHYILKI